MGLVVLIWTANILVSRYSMLEGLRAIDLVYLRYGVSGLVMLPISLRLGLRDLGGLGLKRGITLTLLAGSPYMAIFYSGISLAPASHGAVLNPGFVPLVVFLGQIFFRERRFCFTSLISLFIIIAGLTLVTGASFSTRGNILLGDILILTGGLCWGLFTLFAKRWAVNPHQSAAIIQTLSLGFLLPFSFLLLLAPLPSVSLSHFILQGIFQGLIVGIASLYLLVYGVGLLGPKKASLFSPVVPLATTLLAIPLLGEVPSQIQWVGIILVVFGIVSVARLS